MNTEQSVERPWEPTGITIQVLEIFFSGGCLNNCHGGIHFKVIEWALQKVAIMLADKALCGGEGGGVGNNSTRRPPSVLRANMALVPSCP